MSKLTTIATSLVVALAAFSAHAQVEDPSGYCNTLGQLAEEVAEARDNGIPRSVIDYIVSHIGDDREYADSAVAVEFAYSRPDKAPGEVGTFIFEVCWEVYGESA